MASYQLSAILASTSRETLSLFYKGFSISYFTSLRASWAVSMGPSKISSSCIYNNIFQPNYSNYLSLEILTIAAMTMSAAPP